jgi:hypothetical protein
MTYNHDELFSERWASRPGEVLTERDVSIVDRDQYGAAVTTLRALRTALVAMDSTGVTTGPQRNQVWGVAQFLAEHIRRYQQVNRLPPPDVTP